MKKFTKLICLVGVMGSLCGAAPTLPGLGKEPKIFLHNRIVTKIHGKTISMYDVQKKMDLFLKRNHPEVYDSVVDRYQFYASSWRATLEDMLHTELILMEAEELKIEIPEGDIKEEMENQFGHKMIDRFEQLGISYDEAHEMIKEEIIVRSLSWYRIWASVMQRVNPEAIKLAYEQHIQGLPNEDTWVYQTITIKDGQSAETEALAKEAYALLSAASQSDSAEALAQSLREKLPGSAHVTLSNELALTSHELSPSNLKVLENLTPGSFSAPIAGGSRSSSNPVYRIFFLKDFKKQQIPDFQELEPKIKNRLTGELATNIGEAYFEKLRKRFCCEDAKVETLTTPNYEPFSIH